MPKLRAAALALLAGLCCGPASAQNPQLLQYHCDLNGMVGVMTVQVETIGNTGVVIGSGPDRPITGVIGTGGGTLVYQGEIRSQTGYYVFTGRDAFADFTDMQTHARFRVRFDQRQDGALILTINPFGRGPTQHLCVPAR